MSPFAPFNKLFCKFSTHGPHIYLPRSCFNHAIINLVLRPRPAFRRFSTVLHEASNYINYSHLVQNGTHIKGSLKLIRMHGFMYNIVIRLYIQTLLTHTTKPSSAGNQGFGWNTNTCLCMKPLFAS